MFNLLQITPFIHVRELEPALAFFQDVLGFTVQFRRGDYAYVQREGVALRIWAHTDEYRVPGIAVFGITSMCRTWVLFTLN